MKQHDLDLVSLIAGAVFAVVALVHLVGASTDQHADVAWLAPVILVGLGVAGLAGALRSSRSGEADTPRADGSADEA